MSHFTGVGADDSDIFEYLESMRQAGMTNILALRGDAPMNVDPAKLKIRYASELVTLVKEQFPEFSVGVAGYPEAHPDSVSIKDDLDFMKKKVECGADFVTTQLFFENRVYFDYVDRLKDMGVACPVLPGIMPITSLSSLKRLLSLCDARIPGKLYNQFESAHNEGGTPAVREVGIAHAAAQVKGLLEGGAPGVHLYTLNKADACLEICRRVGI